MRDVLAELGQQGATQLSAVKGRDVLSELEALPKTGKKPSGASRSFDVPMTERLTSALRKTAATPMAVTQALIGAGSFIPAGLATVGSMRFVGPEKAAEIGNKTMETIGRLTDEYLPFPAERQEILAPTNAPFEALDAYGTKRADQIFNETGSPAAAAMTATFWKGMPFWLGGVLGGAKSVKGSNWYRELTIKERALADTVAKNVKADLKNGKIGADIREQWKNPANREALIKKYVQGESVPTGETIKQGTTTPTAELPPGQGFTRSNKINADVVLNKTRQIEGPGKITEPLALPEGQGFELPAKTPYLPVKSEAIQMGYEPRDVLAELGEKPGTKKVEIVPEKTPANVPTTFKEFVISKGQSWPMKSTDPEYPSLLAEWNKKTPASTIAPVKIVQPKANKEAAPAKADEQPTKEPWEMDESLWLREYEKKNHFTPAPGSHEQYVRQAIKDGKPVPKSVIESYPDLTEIITDPAKVQEIKNSIAEGELLLKSGRKVDGTKRSPEQLAAIQRAVNNSKRRIGDFGVNEAVEGSPIYQAIENIKANGGLNLESLKKDYGKEQILELVRKRPGIASKNGAAKLDEIAQEHGFVDGDALLQEILGAKSKKALTKEAKESFDAVHGEAYSLAKKGYVETDNPTTTAIDLNVGEKVKIKGKADEFTVKEPDKKGNVVLKDGETIKADAFSQIPVTHIKRIKNNQVDIPGASFAETFELAPSKGGIGEKPKPHIGNKTGKMFDERGSLPLSSDSEIVQAIIKARGRIKEALPHLESAGRRIYESGKTKFVDWIKGMNEALGDAWQNFKSYAKEIFDRVSKPLKNEMGKVGYDIKRDDIYKANRTAGSPIKDKIKADAKEVIADIKKMADEYLGAISTRLGNIDPSLKTHLRRFEMNRGIKASERIRQVEPMLQKIAKMSKEDRTDFDLARKNGDASKLKQIIDKYGFWKEYTQGTRKVLNELYEQAKEVGFDVGYRKHFHPRIVKDSKGFLEYFYKLNDWPMIEKAIRAKETELGRYLELDEKASLVNSMLRGYGPDNIKLSKPGQLKEREIEFVTPELNKFYMDSDAALLRYITTVTDAIESRKAFGVKGKDAASPTDTIGHYILDLLAKGKIKPEHESILRDIYTARFNEQGTRGIVGLYKNLSYMDTMGSPISAITQLGDMAWAFYKNGIKESIKAMGPAIRGKSAITKEQIGIDQIAKEFSDTSKAATAVSRMFDIIGLSKMDNIGKETLINSTLSKAKKMAQENPAKLKKELEPIFEGETDALIKDLKDGNITENVKLYAFNTLADFQPIALSEMPAKYLSGGNGRIFYMLKSFTLKQFDAYRRECFQKMATPGTRIQGMKNLVKLSACFVAANASADVIKGIILNRDMDPGDLAVDNLLRLVGISKFITWKARMEGVGSAAVRNILPPFKFADALSKDIMKAGDGKGLESVQSIPIVGKLYYWWFGKGAKKNENKQSNLRRLTE